MNKKPCDMSEEELRHAMIQKDKNGRYTAEANLCYLELKKRLGLCRTEIGANPVCGKYAADVDYYGTPDLDSGGFYDLIKNIYYD